MSISKNGISLMLCYVVNFILGCEFWRKLRNSLMSPNRHFQNIKQSSKYLFCDLIYIYIYIYVCVCVCVCVCVYASV